MASLRIVNASPLILIGKLRQLALLHDGDREVNVPDSVFKEVEDPSMLGRLPGWDPSVPNIERKDDIPIPPEIQRFALDPGESMVLALALAHVATGDDVEVVLDEKKGRKAAQALSLKLVGTAGLLIRAKSEGRISVITPLLDELEKQGMYLDLSLRQMILEMTGE